MLDEAISRLLPFARRVVERRMRETTCTPRMACVWRELWQVVAEVLDDIDAGAVRVVRDREAADA